MLAPHGDCFVVLSEDGLYWGAKDWTSKSDEAQRFAGPLDAYSKCAALARDLRDRLGIACNVAYIPSSEVSTAKIPRLESREGVAISTEGQNL